MNTLTKIFIIGSAFISLGANAETVTEHYKYQLKRLEAPKVYTPINKEPLSVTLVQPQQQNSNQRAEQQKVNPAKQLQERYKPANRYLPLNSANAVTPVQVAPENLQIKVEGQQQ